MSAHGTPGQAPALSTSQAAGRARGGNDPATGDLEPSYNNVQVFVFPGAVVVSTPEHTRIENTERGVTDYGEPLTAETRAALREAERRV